jgi:Raf kinase inhibitor-like YbhB/YbcL family protein
MKPGWKSAQPLLALALLLAASVAIAAAQQTAPPAPGGAAPAAPPAPPMRLTSTAFKDSAPLPTKYTCSAQPSAVSPPLQWTDVPKQTVSFALILHDLEPRGRGGFADSLHWMLWNIPASVTQLPEGVPASAELPDGTRQFMTQQGTTNVGFRGPCPPQGVALPHHYVVDLFALDVKLDLPATAARPDVEKAIDGHIVGHAVLVGLFNR